MDWSPLDSAVVRYAYTPNAHISASLDDQGVLRKDRAHLGLGSTLPKHDVRAARLHFETHGIECSHRSTSFGDAARTH